MIRCVKLNDPLMGTETLRGIINLGIFCLRPVKLNNPHQGTETPLTISYVVNASMLIKLNNSLMGTESNTVITSLDFNTIC